MTYDDFNEALRYDPETGLIHWRTPPRSRAKAGTTEAGFTAHGYKFIQFKKKRYSYAVIAWLLHNKVWPDKQIGYLDGDPTNTKPDNMVQGAKPASRGERGPYSASRTKSGQPGVGHYGNRWKAYIRVSGKTKWLGTFETKDEAIRARKAAEEQLDVDAASR